MKASAKLVIGDVEYNFTFEDEKEELAMQKAIYMANYPKECNCCKVDVPSNFKLISNTANNFRFFNIECQNCGARAKLGTLQPTGSGFFWHEFKENNYKKEN